MRIWIAAIGSKAREGFEGLTRMYLDRVAAYLPGGARAGLEAPLFRTPEALWEAVERERSRTAPLVVMLDEDGRQMDSEGFAAWLGRERDGGRQLIIFAIGPAEGWGDPGKAKREGGAERMLLSLGKMTMPHELARVVIAEQVYRALTILSGHPYHRS